ncbi:MAG TPA: DUF6678 family protein [Terriglobia bacterium]|nr:DUF6678 family protein [Terriglobia bacterium]
MNKNNKKVFDFGAHSAIVDRLVAKQFSRSFMSNAKWRRLITTLDSVEPELQVIWKFVGSKNDGVRWSLPAIESMQEEYLDNRFWFGPLYYKEIEWLEIPLVAKPWGKENLPITYRDQDIEKVRKALEKSGRWSLEDTGTGLRIYGYR